MLCEPLQITTGANQEASESTTKGQPYAIKLCNCIRRMFGEHLESPIEHSNNIICNVSITLIKNIYYETNIKPMHKRLPNVSTWFGKHFLECSPNRKSRQHINMYECCQKTFWQMFCMCYWYVFGKHFRDDIDTLQACFAKTFSDNIHTR